MNCESGKYVSVAGPSSCVPCPGSGFSTIPGSIDEKDCLCAPGYIDHKSQFGEQACAQHPFAERSSEYNAGCLKSRLYTTKSPVLNHKLPMKFCFRVTSDATWQLLRICRNICRPTCYSHSFQNQKYHRLGVVMMFLTLESETARIW